MTGAFPAEGDPGFAAARAPAWTEAAVDSQAVVDPRATADFDLLDRARRGDRAAFASLVERHYLVLASLVRQRAGPRAPVEDLVQETFAKVLAHLPGFRRRASFLTWT